MPTPASVLGPTKDPAKQRNREHKKVKRKKKQHECVDSAHYLGQLQQEAMKFFECFNHYL